MANQWHVQLEGKVFGPLNDQDLARLASEGRITPVTPTQLNRSGEWVQASRIKGLFEKVIDNQPENRKNNSIPPDTRLKPKNKATEYQEIKEIVSSIKAVRQDEAPYRSGYVSSNLLPNEYVIYWADMHWFIFVVPVLLLLLPILVAAIFRVNLGPMELICVGAFTWPIGIVILISRIVQFFTNQYAITNQRVVMKSGFLSLKTLEVFHEKIASLSVNQDIAGLIFDYGTVIVSAMGDKQQFGFIKNPSVFRRRVQEQQKTSN